MPESDCGICNKLINCAGVLTSQVEFQTLTAKLLCELVDAIQTLVVQLQTEAVDSG